MPSLDRRRLLLGSAGLGLLGLGGCATTRAGAPGPALAANPVPFAERRPPIAPVHARMDRIFDITVCLRPFRAAGPPIWLGGATPAALARTGRRYDGWLPYPPEPADYAAGLRDIHAAAAQAGRSPAAITPALFVSVRVDRSLEDGRRALGDYALANYGMPLEDLEKIQAVVTGTAAEVTESLHRYVAAGARHLVIRLGALSLQTQRDQLEQVAALIPALS